MDGSKRIKIDAAEPEMTSFLLHSVSFFVKTRHLLYFIRDATQLWRLRSATFIPANVDPSQ